MANLSDYFPDYHPAMMGFNGSTGYYNDASVSTTGNKITSIARFNIASFTGAGSVRIIGYVGDSTFWRLLVILYANDHATAELRQKIRLFIRDESNVTCLDVLSINTVTDGDLHTIFGAYDGDSGLLTFIIDGQDADDSGYSTRTLTTAVLDAGTGQIGFGADYLGADIVNGDIGFIGVRDAYLTNWSDFMDPNGKPLPLDESGWTEWGSTQPRFWNEHADMENNLGSAGNMTRNGTIIVGKGGN